VCMAACSPGHCDVISSPAVLSLHQTYEPCEVGPHCPQCEMWPSDDLWKPFVCNPVLPYYEFGNVLWQTHWSTDVGTKDRGQSHFADNILLPLKIKKLLLHPIFSIIYPCFEKNESRLMRSQCCLHVCVSCPLLLGKSSVNMFPQQKNTHASIGEMLDKSFSMQCVSYKKKVGDQFLP
jgi:hypothetical protein